MFVNLKQLRSLLIFLVNWYDNNDTIENVAFLMLVTTETIEKLTDFACLHVSNESNKNFTIADGGGYVLEAEQGGLRRL